MKSGLEHVIWDWNGTLLDDSVICVEVFNEMLAKRNSRKIDGKAFADAMDFPLALLFERIGFDLNEEKFETLISEFLDKYEARRMECSVRSEFKKVIKDLWGKNISMSVLSAAHDTLLKKAVKHYGLGKYFIKVLGLSDTLGVSKVQNGIKLIADVGIKKANCLLIGDTMHDFEVAAEIGVECWLFFSGHCSIDKLRSTGATVFETSVDLADGLLNLVYQQER